MTERHSSPVAAATLPLFSNHRAVCARCGRRYEIRVHFDHACALVSGDHFHRLCPCGHRWEEQARMAGLPHADPTRGITSSS